MTLLKKASALAASILLMASFSAQADVVCEGSSGLIVTDVSDCIDNSTNDDSIFTDESVHVGDVGNVSGNVSIGGTHVHKSPMQQQSQ